MSSTVIVAVTVLLGAGVLLAFSWTLLEKTRRVRFARTQLGVRMAELPLSRLLMRHGCLPRQFLYANPLIRVEAILHACEKCEAVRACQSALERGDSPKAFTFCPNREALQPGS